MQEWTDNSATRRGEKRHVQGVSHRWGSETTMPLGKAGKPHGKGDICRVSQRMSGSLSVEASEDILGRKEVSKHNMV